LSFQTSLVIGIGGFIGAILRGYITGIVNNNITHNIPFGTLAVNLIGSFILGSLFAFFTYTDLFSPSLKSMLSTGMMGALTTYSTFAMETFFLLNGGIYIMAFSNILLNVIGTIVMAGAGFKLFETFLK
jgi:CrcB protein